MATRPPHPAFDGLCGLLAPLRRLVFFAMLSLSPLCAPSHTEAPVTEQEVKATLIFKFPAFVSWPPKAARKGPMVLCILGQDPFGPLLDHYKETSINGRAVKVHYAQTLAEVGDCQMLFIAESDPQKLTAILNRLQDKPILTFADQPGFAHQGVMVNFIHQEDSILFEVNPRAAKKAGLKIGSQLLRLAVIVR